MDLDAASLDEVQRILRELAPDCEVLAHGSRVRGRPHRFSDLDLALRAPAPLPPERLDAIREAFAVSDLPITVDVADWHALPAWLQRAIEETHEVVRPAPRADDQRSS